MHLIADGDRDRASEALRGHYQRGRLSVDELAERLDVALSARTSRELRTAFRGLPSPWSPGELASTFEGATRAASRVLLFLALAGVWSMASLFLLVAFVVVLAAGASAAAQVAVPALWIAVSYLAWRAWKRPSDARTRG